MLVTRAGWVSPRSDAKAVLRLFTNSWMSLLLLAIPFGFAAHFAHWDSIAIFVLVGITPASALTHECKAPVPWHVNGLEHHGC